MATPGRGPRVVRCATTADVATALTFAQAHRIPVAVRSGGNSFADRPTTDGLLVDVDGMRDLRMDGDLLVTGPGVRIRDLRRRLGPGDRAISCGWCPEVALGGAVLGGGYGSLSRLYGLGCDHLVAAEVVLADGRTLWSDAERDPDLFYTAVEALVDYLLAGPVVDQSRVLEFIPWGGAMTRVPPDATAFVHQRTRFILKHAAWIMRRASDESRRDARRWVDGSWSTSHPWGSGMIYPNSPEPDRAPLDPAYHGTNLARLRRVLARYDPGGKLIA